MKRLTFIVCAVSLLLFCKAINAVEPEKGKIDKPSAPEQKTPEERWKLVDTSAGVFLLNTETGDVAIYSNLVLVNAFRAQSPNAPTISAADFEKIKAAAAATPSPKVAPEIWKLIDASAGVFLLNTQTGEVAIYNNQVLVNVPRAQLPNNVYQQLLINLFKNAPTGQPRDASKPANDKSSP